MAQTLKGSSRLYSALHETFILVERFEAAVVSPGLLNKRQERKVDFAVHHGDVLL